MARKWQLPLLAINVGPDLLRVGWPIPKTNARTPLPHSVACLPPPRAAAAAAVVPLAAADSCSVVAVLLLLLLLLVHRRARSAAVLDLQWGEARGVAWDSNVCSRLHSEERRGVGGVEVVVVVGRCSSLSRTAAAAGAAACGAQVAAPSSRATRGGSSSSSSRSNARRATVKLTSTPAGLAALALEVVSLLGLQLPQPLSLQGAEALVVVAGAAGAVGAGAAVAGGGGGASEVGVLCALCAAEGYASTPTRWILRFKAVLTMSHGALGGAPQPRLRVRFRQSGRCKPR